MHAHRTAEAKDLLDVYLEAEEAEGSDRLSTENMLKNIFDVFLGGQSKSLALERPELW